MIKAIAIDDEPLALKLISTYCGKSDFIHLEKTFTRPTEALQYLRDRKIDLVFVDIQMPAMTGINLVKALPKQIMVIFTTAFTNYAIESYELNAVDYLLKPISFSRFEKAVLKAKEFYQYMLKSNHAEDNYIFIRADYSLIKIYLTDILYIEGLADYIKIFITNRKTIVARMTMKDMCEKLPEKGFKRVHRSFIIPLHRILSVRNNTVYLPEREVPIGKTYTEDFNLHYKP
ncbi:LytTR family DNA-binding domain-containing protein [Mucilaginibacter sp. HMF5004]|uniref:LytR/AlgR family response regulator transcription factor n=1 Tax=Mucilaginibacter rivuli TaxID=2857527 RepID=UPI001C5FB6AF|nr:LytTR family DNA-binding domain-containing protein [Mucilaginibacter rivuli]MBW4888929.1 LytTR family DNA-binding domain-containing protein [Mucilaginibacter rivuli]